MVWNKLKKYTIYVLNILLVVFLFLFFSYWGVIGYFVFIFLAALYILIKRRKQYILIIKYRASELHKITGGRKCKKKHKKN